MKKLVAFLLPAALAAACTSVETAPSNASGTATGTGGAASSGSGATSGSGGASAGSSGLAGGGGGLVTASSSGSSGGGGTSCAGLDTFIDVVGDGPLQHFTALCANTYVLGNPTGPVAFTPVGGGILPTLVIVGCASAAQGSPELSITESSPSAPGTDDKASAAYVDATQAFWTSVAAGDVSVTLTHYEDVGGVVEGTYDAKVSQGGATKALSGSFRACHEYDIPKP